MPRGRPPLPPDQRKPRLNGNERRKIERAKKLDEIKRLAAEIGVTIVDPSEPTIGDDNGAGAFAQCGPPPLDDPDTALTWTRRVQLVALHAAITDPSIAIKDKLRLAKDLSFVAGASHNRSALESRLMDVERAIDGTRAKGAVEVKATHGLVRPPTARGGSRAGRPRAVEVPPPRSDGA